ncbi:hypothetical protein, partial [Psychrobacter sp. FME6]|uniref:hypothetical protein n=1 Tax=Psychrobacter sp. FME6 TaxID=2487707 RepID=UPI001CE40DF9
SLCCGKQECKALLIFFNYFPILYSPYTLDFLIILQLFEIFIFFGISIILTISVTQAKVAAPKIRPH